MNPGQRRSDGGYIGIYTPKISLPYKFLCGLLVVFFSLTQEKFDIVPVCALARVSFTYLHTTIYTPPQIKFLATPLMLGPHSVPLKYGQLSTKYPSLYGYFFTVLRDSCVACALMERRSLRDHICFALLTTVIFTSATAIMTR